jgi:GT2 family glycosyltransferase
MTSVNASDPRLIVIVLTWNGKGDVLECLESVAKTDYGNFETVVVDNASTDGTAEEVRARFPGVTIVANAANLGYAGGNNAGMRVCAGRGAEFYLLLNNDLVLEPGCIRELVDVAGLHPEGGMFGPKTYQYGSDRVLDFVGGALDWKTGATKSVGVGEKDLGQYDEVRDYDFMNGHALLVRKSVTDEIGLLDEDYFIYNEETDWCVRARRRGWACLYAPRAVVWHKVSRSRLSQSRDYLLVRNRILFMRKNATRRQLARFLFDFCLAQLPRRAASLVRRGDWAGLAVMAKAVGWHLGMWRRRNPLAALREREAR